MVLEYHVSQQMKLPLQIGDDFCEGELAELFYALDMRTNHMLRALKVSANCQSTLETELNDLIRTLLSHGVYLPVSDGKISRSRDEITTLFTIHVTEAAKRLNAEWESIESMKYYVIKIPIRELVRKMITAPHDLNYSGITDVKSYEQAANRIFRAMVHAIGYVVSPYLYTSNILPISFHRSTFAESSH